MIRFFVGSENITEEHIYLDDPQDMKHLTKVLRARVGDKVSISDGEAWEYVTEIGEIGSTEVILNILEKSPFLREPETRVTLYQGIPKAAKLETIVQKTVELGVYKIVPVFMSRTVVEDKGKFHKKQERLQKIADEAVKQCKRGIIPEVSDAMDFSGMLEDIKANNFDGVILAYESEEGFTIKDAIRDSEGDLNIKKGSRVALVIGPEGGFEEEETETVKDIFGRKAAIVSLGKTILRTETAGMAALAMIMYELEL